MTGSCTPGCLQKIAILTLICTSSRISAEKNDRLHCKSQGPLKVQEGKFPSSVRLPFCQQYSNCTCCERRHAQAFGLKTQSSLDAGSLSEGCKEMTAKLACRLCDPEVGVGLKGGVCEETCDAWHELCRDDFFEYHSLSKELMPCSDNSLVCSQLRELAADGADLCRKAGLRVSGSGSGKKCFDGSVPDLLETCKAKAKPRPDRWKAIMSKAQPLLLLLMVLAVCGGILALFFSAHNMQSTALERTQQPADLPPARAAGIAAIERHNRKQS